MYFFLIWIIALIKDYVRDPTWLCRIRLKISVIFPDTHIFSMISEVTTFLSYSLKICVTKVLKEKYAKLESNHNDTHSDLIYIFFKSVIWSHQSIKYVLLRIFSCVIYSSFEANAMVKQDGNNCHQQAGCLFTRIILWRFSHKLNIGCWHWLGHCRIWQ